MPPPLRQPFLISFLAMYRAAVSGKGVDQFDDLSLEWAQTNGATGWWRSSAGREPAR